MSEKELKGAIKTLSEHPEVKCGSYAFVEDANITYADIYLLLNYIRKLEQETQDLKEKNEFLMKRDNKCQMLEQELDKSYIRVTRLLDYYDHYRALPSCILNELIELQKELDILKEVE